MLFKCIVCKDSQSAELSSHYNINGESVPNDASSLELNCQNPDYAPYVLCVYCDVVRCAQNIPVVDEKGLLHERLKTISSYVIDTCVLCAKERPPHERYYFNKEGEEKIYSDEPSGTSNFDICVCSYCLEEVEMYNDYANVHYMWNALSDEQQAIVWPYIHEASRHSLCYEVFDSAAERFCGDTFEEWLDSVHSVFHSVFRPRIIEAVNMVN